MRKRSKEYIPNSVYGEILFIEEIDSKRANSGNLQRMGKFKCYCGNIFERTIYEIVAQNTTSCGCKLNKNLKSEYKGCTYTPEYKVWNNFINRCTNSKAVNWHRYGGRGITFCDKWRRFEGFIEDMGKRPSKNHSLDRIDNDGNYCKENCKWATYKEQTRNRSTNIYVIYKGEKKILKDVAIELNLDYQPIKRRLDKGLSLEQSINKSLKFKRK